mmetsp:Transcript_10490/g.19193  ORF Transcript_10490/g.19193 Transcript_10490/m.19193 type:complete len:608 (+) Transcript_10490:2-1825(+)
MIMEHLEEEEQEDFGSVASTPQRENIRYFQELATHPALLTTALLINEEEAKATTSQHNQSHPQLLQAKGEGEPTSVAFVLHDPMLLPGLLEQVALYPDITRLYVVEPSQEDCDRRWKDLSSLQRRLIQTLETLDGYYNQDDEEEEDDEEEDEEEEEQDDTIDITCVAMDNVPTAFQIDIVFLLDEDCPLTNSDSNANTRLPFNFYDDDVEEDEEDEDVDYYTYDFWFQHLSPDMGTLVTCLGPTLPLDHPLFQHKNNVYRDNKYDKVDALETSNFTKVIEYDLRLPHHSRFAHTMGVAFKAQTAAALWRMNEAQYNFLQYERLERYVDRLVWFDSAVMTTIRYPSKHSAVQFCSPWSIQINEDAADVCNEHGGQHGYDPEFPNYSMQDNFQVSKSQVGDHAGRGVFTKVDIPLPGSYIALENSVQSVMMEWRTTELHNDMIEHIPIHAKSQGRIVFVFAEAYGYSQEPWGMPQEAVQSDIFTFVNHGCNGTANVAENDVTETNVDLEMGVPNSLVTRIDTVYAPHADRDHAKMETTSVTVRPIEAGEEILDNYLAFGGDTYFRENVESLRMQCSGEEGMVEHYQKHGVKNLSELEGMFPKRETSSAR